MIKLRLIIPIALIAAFSQIQGATLKLGKCYNLTEKGVYHPVMSVDGTRLLYTSSDYKGLNLYDLVTRSVTRVSDAEGAGFNPVFSGDGMKVYYRCRAIDHQLAVRNIESYDVGTAQNKEIQPMSRDEVELVQEPKDVAVKSGVKMVKGTRMNLMPYAFPADKAIIVSTGGGIEQKITPIMDARSYLWVSMSGDAKRLLFKVPTKGIFVSNIDGSGLKRIADGSYPVWMGNDYVIFTRSTNDGYHVLTSQLIAINVSTGEETELTTPESMAEEASVSMENGKIVYSDINGNARIIEYEIGE